MVLLLLTEVKVREAVHGLCVLLRAHCLPWCSRAGLTLCYTFPVQPNIPPSLI